MAAVLLMLTGAILVIGGLATVSPPAAAVATGLILAAVGWDLGR